MRYLVTGSEGMLGTAVMTLLKERGESAVGIDYVAKDLDRKVDISQWDELVSCPHLKNCDIVLHLAAATDVDRCEKDPDLAFCVNALGTEFLARICAERDLPMVYVSTAAVFAGNPKKEPYSEYDEVKPLNIYARSKWHGEEAVRLTVPRHWILRAGWMMGGGSEEKKFVGKIVEQLLQGKRKLLAVDDKRGSPTYTLDFAKNLFALIASPHYGTFHVANHGVCTRHDIAKKIIEFLGLDAVVEPVPSTYFPLPAPRPDSECLANYKLGLLGLDFMPHWESSLKDYLRWLVPALRK